MLLLVAKKIPTKYIGVAYANDFMVLILLERVHFDSCSTKLFILQRTLHSTLQIIASISILRTRMDHHQKNLKELAKEWTPAIHQQRDGLLGTRAS